ncbi:MAG: chromate transporter [Lachnospiraceae bacterium]|nr:chromate transporter [Candidatus Equihabitans merdae]
MEKQEKTSLLKLFLAFAKVGVMTFGGGYAMLPILQREIVENNHWATNEDLTNYFAIGQSTPGVIAVNTATFIGHKERGILGGIAATLGVVFPSLIIITLLAGLISHFADNIYVQKAFNGIRICVCVLILNAIVKLWKSAIKGAMSFIIFLLAVLAVLILDASPVILVVCGIVIGVIYELINSRKAVKS